MAVELKELTSSKEFEYMVDKRIEFNSVYRDLWVSTKRLDRIHKALADARKAYVRGKKSDIKRFGNKKGDNQLMRTAILLENYHQLTVEFSKKHNMDLQEVKELVDAKAYLKGE